MAGLNKEVWITDIMEGFYPDSTFMEGVRDMTAWVDNNTINLAEAGADPEVLVNNTVYPIPFQTRADIPLSLPLDDFITKGTVIRNLEIVEAAYDKRMSVAQGHQKSLRAKLHTKAAYAYAPTSDSAFTPVLPTTGAVLGGVKKITLNDVIDLSSRFDMFDAPSDRVLVLHPQHLAALRAEDKDLFKSIMQEGKQGFNLYGFKVYFFSKTPTFVRTSGTKKAFGAASAATDTISSIAFCNGEVMKSLGDFRMNERLHDPELDGDMINFGMRALALPIRNKAIGAIYSAAS